MSIDVINEDFKETPPEVIVAVKAYMADKYKVTRGNLKNNVPELADMTFPQVEKAAVDAGFRIVGRD